tara:strand:- start:621 stop:965 length:345 start_codon:yes stop_codon:yes gene_type:complete
MEGSKSITLTPAVLLSLVLTIIPAAGGVIYKMSQSDTKLQAIIAEVDKLRKKKGTNVSVLVDRISALEATVAGQQLQLKDIKAEITLVEESMTSWSEREFGKVYRILNDNPVGK